VFAAEDGYVLIHDAAGHAHEMRFGALRQARDLEPVERPSAEER
jgi:hypothetical protein